jgi:NAD(P)-dependent dehydrogenase (short-subunit alcohol dehydrogenase family)
MRKSESVANEFRKKVVLVTGGGTGIGRAIATVFADAGARVVVCGRNYEQLKEVAEDLGGHAIAADVSNEESVQALYEQIIQTEGTLDILVNNAGVTGPVSNAEDMDMSAECYCASNTRHLC